MAQIKTYSQKPSEVKREWYHIDASDYTLGRLSSVVANLLIGKHKPTYTPHTDAGDYVIVTNIAKVKVTGNKLNQKTYYRHSGYPGALKEQKLKDKLESKPEEVLEHAVKGMLPKNKLLSQRMARLKIYRDADHNHTAQKPKKVEVK